MGTNVYCATTVKSTINVQIRNLLHCKFQFHWIMGGVHIPLSDERDV